jgi:preprotein translocase subunit SecY
MTTMHNAQHTPSGALSGAPALVEALTHLTAFRGFAGTSVLIMVGVATDTARLVFKKGGYRVLG